MLNLAYISPVAGGIPFNNATNGFTATNVQTAIEEAKNSIAYSTASATGTVTTTSGTFSVMTTMTLTPVAGTYLCIFSGNMDITSGVNGTGEIALFVNAVQATDSTRDMTLNVALLLGLIGTATVGASGSQTMTIATVNGSQAIDGRYRSVSGDTFRARSRSLTLIRLA